MTDQNAPIRKAHANAEQHLTGIKATAEQHQQAIEQHLADTRQPVGGEQANGRY